MELVEALAAIGFTEYEAKVYLALLRENPATGYLLSKQSGVPRSMVYEALGRLRSRGAVLESAEGKATLYRPLPPDTLLERIRSEHRSVMQDLRQGLQRLYDARSDEHLWTLVGRPSMLSYGRQMIQAAQAELMLVLADPDLNELREEIVATCDRGVSVRALLTGDEELGCGQVAYHPPRESELQEITGSLVIVSDDREALIASGTVEESATITNNRNLVMIARQFIWMELFAQRVYATLGPDLVARLDPEDRRILEGLIPLREQDGSVPS